MLNSWKTILYIGVPIASSRVIIPISIGIVTRLVSNYGQYAVAGFGVCTKIEFFSLPVVKALATSYGPFIGQNMGARKFERVIRSIKISKRFAMYWGVGLTILLFLAAKPLATLFNKDLSVISTISLYFTIVPISFGLQGVYVLSNTALNVLNRPFHAAGLTIIQMFVLYIPLAYFGSHYFQLKGIFAGIAVAYMVTGIVSNMVLNSKIDKMEILKNG